MNEHTQVANIKPPPEVRPGVANIKPPPEVRPGVANIKPPPEVRPGACIYTECKNIVN